MTHYKGSSNVRGSNSHKGSIRSQSSQGRGHPNNTLRPVANPFATLCDQAFADPEIFLPTGLTRNKARNCRVPVNNEFTGETEWLCAFRVAQLFNISDIKCSKGKYCKENHPNNVCISFMNGDNCKFGSRCKYPHYTLWQPRTAQSATFVEKTRFLTKIRPHPKKKKQTKKRTPPKKTSKTHQIYYRILFLTSGSNFYSI